jgi:RNA polymerase sigma-70 factor (ECF subfamily)
VSHDVPDFDEIVRAHRQAIYRVARRIVRTHEEADEVTQETFVRAWRALPGFRGEARLSTWLVRIAIHTARSMPRSRG